VFTARAVRVIPPVFLVFVIRGPGFDIMSGARVSALLLEKNQ